MSNHILGRLVYLAAVSPLVIWLAAIAASPADADRTASDRLVSLGPESRQYDNITEGAYWPALDLSDVAAHVATPDPKAKASFVTLVSHVLDAAWIAENLTEEVHFLKGWRAADRKTFLAQYRRAPYLIRIKDQTVAVVGGGRVWTHPWIAVAIQRMDGSVWVDKRDPDGLLGVAARFLAGSLRRPADGKIRTGTQVAEGYVLGYVVEWAEVPDVMWVNAWTDGRTAMFLLQKRGEKMALPPLLQPP
jgi:hypothetical protein